MMLMKTPTSGGATGTGGGRDVIFRLSVEPDRAAPAKMRTWGEGIRREQAIFATEGKRFSREWGDSWIKEFDRVLERARMTSRQMAADWSNSARSFGSLGGGSIAGGGPMNMAALSGAGPGAMNMAALAAAARANQPGIMNMGALASANVYSLGPMNMAALAAAARLPGGVPGGGGAAPLPAAGGGRFNFGSLNNVLSGGGQLARGAVYAGLVGEQDSQKILDTLLRMEGLLGLIHGGLALGKGLGGLGIPGVGLGAGVAGAAAIGGVGFAAASAYELFGQANKSGNFTRRLSWWNPQRWAYANTLDNGGEYLHLQQSAGRVDLQEKYLTEQEKMRRGDATEFDRLTAERSGNREIRRRGHRGDAAERLDLQADLLESQRALQEIDSQGAARSQQQVEQRKAVVKEIYDITRAIADADIRGQREATSLALSRAQHVSGVSQQRLDAQGGLASSAVGRYRSDLSKFGSLDPLQRMRVQSAAMAFRSGRATREQEELLSGFNEFGDQVDASRAQRGMAHGGGLFAGGAAAASAGVTEFQKQAQIVASASLNVITKHELLIKEDKEAGLSTSAAEQVLEFLKEMKAAHDRDLATKLDELRREMNGQQKAREVIARR